MNGASDQLLNDVGSAVETAEAARLSRLTSKEPALPPDKKQRVGNEEHRRAKSFLNLQAAQL